MRLTYLLTSVFCLLTAFSSAHAETKEETLKLLDLFGNVFEKVRKEYVEEPSDKDLIESAINGMLSDLDPHSSYLNKDSFSEMRVQAKGEFGGLGIEVTMRNGMVYVVSPIDDTPAFDAGMEAGDFISHIDGESVIGLTISEAVKKMRGKPGTKIKLTVLRDGEDESLEVEIIRDVITIKPVRSRAEGDVAYVRVISFSEKTMPGLEKAIKKEIEEIGEDKIKGVVLDLRNNPGGLLNQAIDVSDAFLEKGEIVSTRGRQASETKRFNASSGDLIDGMPLVVLINGGSASASEIVAGALQDHGRAVVVGTKSFGKGSVQTVIPLPENSAIRLTTSLYYTPSGRSIQAEGIVPDIEIERAKIEFVNKKRRTSEASLRGHIKNKNGEEEDDKKEEKKSPTKAANDNKKDKKDKEGAEGEADASSLYNEDYQLGRAVDLIRAIYLHDKRASESK